MNLEDFLLLLLLAAVAVIAIAVPKFRKPALATLGAVLALLGLNQLLKRRGGSKDTTPPKPPLKPVVPPRPDLVEAAKKAEREWEVAKEVEKTVQDEDEARKDASVDLVALEKLAKARAKNREG